MRDLSPTSGCAAKRGGSQLGVALSNDFVKFEAKFVNVRVSAKFRKICLLSKDFL